MKKLNLGEKIEPIYSEDHHENGHVEGADHITGFPLYQRDRLLLQ
jgi:hypothetical protein